MEFGLGLCLAKVAITSMSDFSLMVKYYNNFYQLIKLQNKLVLSLAKLSSEKVSYLLAGSKL